MKEIPGPGNYEHEKHLNKGIAYSMGERRVENVVNEVPGPGRYNSKLDYVREK